MERRGIEPRSLACDASVLPLNHHPETRANGRRWVETGLEPATSAPMRGGANLLLVPAITQRHRPAAPPRRIELPSPDRQSGCFTRCIRGHHRLASLHLVIVISLSFFWTPHSRLYLILFFVARLFSSRPRGGSNSPHLIDNQAASPDAYEGKRVPPAGLEPASASLKWITVLFRPEQGKSSKTVFSGALPLSYSGMTEIRAPGGSRTRLHRFRRPAPLRSGSGASPRQLPGRQGVKESNPRAGVLEAPRSP